MPDLPNINASANASPLAAIRMNFGTPDKAVLPKMTDSPFADALLRFGQAALLPGGQAAALEAPTYRLPNLVNRMGGTYGMGGEFYARALGQVEAARQLAARLPTGGLASLLQGTQAAPFVAPLYQTLQDPRWGPEGQNLRRTLFDGS